MSKTIIILLLLMGIVLIGLLFLVVAAIGFVLIRRRNAAQADDEKYPNEIHQSQPALQSQTPRPSSPPFKAEASSNASVESSKSPTSSPKPKPIYPEEDEENAATQVISRSSLHEEAEDSTLMMSKDEISQEYGFDEDEI